jgi:hypothetical protein
MSQIDDEFLKIRTRTNKDGPEIGFATVLFEIYKN